MRSFIAFLACSGFIVWAHSRDTKIVGLPSPAGMQQAAPPRQVYTTTNTVTREQYIRELVSAAALTAVSNPQLPPLVFRHLGYSVAPKGRDTVLSVHLNVHYPSQH